VAIMLLADALDAAGGFPNADRWPNHLAGAVFGALVLGPYATADRRAQRIVALALAGAAIYYLAVRFVVEGPIGDSTVTSFVVAGAGAALLCGLSVVAIAPRAFAWRLVPFTLAAGAIGGAMFELKIGSDQMLLAGHAAWQLLMCLALHAGVPVRRAGAVAA
jgi:hypothetical protein